MGSGREDIDVRMLGSGRPFLLQAGAAFSEQRTDTPCVPHAWIEIGRYPLPFAPPTRWTETPRAQMSTPYLNQPQPHHHNQVSDPRRVPQTQAEVAALEAAINARSGLNTDGDVVVTRLRRSEKGMVKRMHEGAEAKQKLYTCLVWARTALTPAELQARLGGVRDLEVQQQTPIRVLHRRSLMTRPKVIHELACVCESLRLDDDGACSYFTLHLRTSAGTYVKEFVHGDFGRTRPSVGELLGCEADILELDVTDVLLADPDD
jgi:tRNA U54 and U55 pseudouridine synthase Pus10